MVGFILILWVAFLLSNLAAFGLGWFKAEALRCKRQALAIEAVRQRVALGEREPGLGEPHFMDVVGVFQSAAMLPWRAVQRLPMPMPTPTGGTAETEGTVL